ncbi:hypothetical protein ABZZ20_06390 [Streptomyces sp. NPDC006430]
MALPRREHGSRGTPRQCDAVRECPEAIDAGRTAGSVVSTAEAQP